MLLHPRSEICFLSFGLGSGGFYAADVRVLRSRGASIICSAIPLASLLSTVKSLLHETSIKCLCANDLLTN